MKDMRGKWMSSIREWKRMSVEHYMVRWKWKWKWKEKPTNIGYGD